MGSADCNVDNNLKSGVLLVNDSKWLCRLCEKYTKCQEYDYISWIWEFKFKRGWIVLMLIFAKVFLRNPDSETVDYFMK